MNLRQIKNNKYFLPILLYLSLVFCFEPKIFVKYNFLNILYVLGLVVAFGAILMLYFLEKRRPSNLFILVVLYRASFFIQTLVARGDILMWGYMSIVLMTLCLVIDYYAKKDINKLLDAIVNVLGVLLTINLLVGFIFPKGIKNEIYFIGIRTRFTDLIFPLLACTAIYLFVNLKQADGKTKKLAIIKSSIIGAVSLVTILKFKIATAIVGIAMFAAAFFVFWKLKKLRKIWIIVVATLLLNVLVVNFRITDWFEWLISGILGKSMNLSGRTEIWNIANDIVRKKLVFGYGMADNGGFVWWGYVNSPKSYWQAHNQWLQLLYDGGLVALVLFILMILYSEKKLKEANGIVVSIHLACLLAFMVMMVAEIYSYTPYFYIMIFLGQHLQMFLKENNPNEENIKDDLTQENEETSCMNV